VRGMVGFVTIVFVAVFIVVFAAVGESRFVVFAMIVESRFVV
jgi:hypothetical protein